MTEALNKPTLIKGWCPGALRPMRSGDGVIVRLRITGGIVPVRLAADIARWSDQWGNGRIDLTGRANLQLRGLSEAHLPALRDAMAEWDLLDASEAGEAVRNVISSPLAGLDPTAVLDVRPLARTLERRLAGDARLHDLPAKFGFAIDDGGRFGLAEVAADVRFEARRGPEFAICLDGAPIGARWFCRPDAVADTAAALSLAFVRFRLGREAIIRRMRDLVAERGADAIGREAGLDDQRIGWDGEEVGCRCEDAVILGVDPKIWSNARFDKAASDEVAADARIKPEHDGERTGHDTGPPIFVGAGLPFGSVSAKAFAGLAMTAAEAGSKELRLTPWRTILVPVPSLEAARAMIARLAAHSFILDPDDPRGRVAACPGGPACVHGTTPVRDDAVRFAARLPRSAGSGTVLHVSGCEKGCAHPRAAAVTLVGRDGRYDLVAGGPASSPPIQRDLTAHQAAEWLTRMEASLTNGSAA